MLVLAIWYASLIRPSMLKVGHPDLIKAKLGSFASQGHILHALPPGMYTACAMSQKV